MTRILLVEDDRQLARTLGLSLEARGYEVLTAADGGRALSVLGADGADLVLLDLGLPDVDGLTLIGRLRALGNPAVIALTVRDGQPDKVSALDMGADDYVVKPFETEELMARIRATLRRTSPPAAPTQPLRYGDLEVDMELQLVTLRGRRVALTRTEFQLLRVFVTNPRKLLTPQLLLSLVWGPGYDENNVRVHVAHLRRKIEPEPGDPSLILTETGLGYRWVADELTVNWP